jgi:hypothetical protein
MMNGIDMRFKWDFNGDLMGFYCGGRMVYLTVWEWNDRNPLI